MDPELAKWKECSRKARAKLEVGQSFSPYISQIGDRKYCLTPRQHELLDITYISSLKAIQAGAPGSAEKPSGCVDVSQSVHRSPWGKDLTCAHSSDIWNIEFQCRLKPSHLLQMHGWPAQVAQTAEDSISGDILKSAIGEGQALQQLGLAIYAYWLCGEGRW